MIRKSKKKEFIKSFLVDPDFDVSYTIRTHAHAQESDMKKIRVLATDPGLSGALCFCDVIDVGDGQYAIGNIRMYDMPVDQETDGKNAPNIVEMLSIIDKEGPFDVAVVERLQHRPGKHNMFRMGLNYGILLGAIRQRSPVDGQIVFAYPPTWKKKMGVTADKATSVALANELLPLCGEPDLQYKNSQDGRAEAFLMAHYYAAHVMPSVPIH